MFDLYTLIAGFTHYYAPVPAKQFFTNYRWDLQKCSLIHMQNMYGIQYRNFGSTASTIVQKNPLFSTINLDDIVYFEKILGVKKVIQDNEELQIANTDWMNKYKGSSKVMLQPDNTEEVHILYLLLKMVVN